MKGKTKNWDLRDGSGTKPIPILSLAFRVRTFFLYPWPIPGQFFITHVYVVVIVEIIKIISILHVTIFRTIFIRRQNVLAKITIPNGVLRIDSYKVLDSPNTSHTVPQPMLIRPKASIIATCSKNPKL